MAFIGSEPGHKLLSAVLYRVCTVCLTLIVSVQLLCEIHNLAAYTCIMIVCILQVA